MFIHFLWLRACSLFQDSSCPTHSAPCTLPQALNSPEYIHAGMAPSVYKQPVRTCLVSVLCGVVFGRHHQAPAFAGTAVHGLYDIDHLLLVLHGPVDLVVVACAQVNHDVLVPEKERAPIHRKNSTESVPFFLSCQALVSIT